MNAFDSTAAGINKCLALVTEFYILFSLHLSSYLNCLTVPLVQSILIRAQYLTLMSTILLLRICLIRAAIDALLTISIENHTNLIASTG